MNKQNLEYVIYIVVVSAVIIFLASLLTAKKQEVDFCRALFNSLIQGRYAVQNLIDWENLKAIDVDVGATYRGLPNDKEKSDYRKTFIKSLSKEFKSSGGKARFFTNWRIYDIKEKSIVVATDDSRYNNSRYFTISKDGKRKLTEIGYAEK